MLECEFTRKSQIPRVQLWPIVACNEELLPARSRFSLKIVYMPKKRDSEYFSGLSLIKNHEYLD